jgi:hypothetical protein
MSALSKPEAKGVSEQTSYRAPVLVEAGRGGISIRVLYPLFFLGLTIRGTGRYSLIFDKRDFFPLGRSICRVSLTKKHRVR